MGKKDGARAGAMSRRPGKAWKGRKLDGNKQKEKLRESIGFMRNSRQRCRIKM
jgi:hypothetical protein